MSGMIINDLNRVVDEMLDGYVACHTRLLIRTNNPRVFCTNSIKDKKNKVGVVSGGGSGHMLAFIGYVRPGMLDAVAVGEIFKAPDSSAFLDAFRCADQSNGVVCVNGNYVLDNDNVREAAALAKKEGIDVRQIIVTDEVSIENGDHLGRGLAGEVFAWKIAGAASEMGYSLDDTERVCRKAIKNLYSLGVGLSACTRPGESVPSFDIVDGTMELGIGHHGEPGITTYKLRSANGIADLMLSEIFRHYSYKKKDELSVMISSLGCTTHMELYILYNYVLSELRQRGLVVHSSFVGDYFTSLNMAGVTMTLFSLDEELKELLEYKNEFL